MHNFELIYSGDLRCLIKHLNSKTEILTDAPVDNHGKGESFSPSDLMVCSLVACMQTIMGIKANEKLWDLSGTKVKISKVMATNPRRIQTIKAEFIMPKLQLSREEQELLEKVAMACPVMQSIHPDIQKDISFKW